MGCCGEKDWNDRKNDITWKLFEAGYTSDNHPEHVKWVDYKYEFEYTIEFLRSSVFEASCGLLKNGIHHHHEMGYMGIDWCPENNNPVFNCPLEKVDCELNHEYLRGRKQCGMVQCAFRFSNKPYNYENSVEKIWDEAEAYKNRLKDEFYRKLKWDDGGRHCACIRWDSERKSWFARYDPAECARLCNNTICKLTGKPLDGKRGNVFYDLKVISVRHDGTFWDGQKVISIIKGKKVFESLKPLVICEAYAKLNKRDILDREKMRLHKELFLNPDTEVEVLNVRAEQRETRDLLQDLQDAREGIEVVHASDLIKKQAAEKRERRMRAKEKKIRRLWRQYKNGDGLARKLLIRKGLLDGEEPEGWMPEAETTKKPEAKQEFEQQSLF